MTTTPGFLLNYTDPNSGLNLPTAWIIRLSNLNLSDNEIVFSTRNPTVTFVVNIYEDIDAYTTGKEAVFKNVRITVPLSNSVFLSYFAALLPQISQASDNYLAVVLNDPPT